MIQPAILQKLEALPPSLQPDLLKYIDFLLYKHAKEESVHSIKSQKNWQGLTAEEAEKRYGYGSMKGQIIMSDDFDEPLEDLAEYM
ncbi:MAG: DUF2281 domain-containing protein [Spirulina sp. SIO3F2]|nr:DUF2281 domain-containing protein [Spirulina sp. SIO3F2]